MRIRVRLATALATRAGRSQLSVELPDGANVADLLRHLSDNHPELPRQLSGILPVIDGSHVDSVRDLNDGDEVALLLPAAGG